MDQGDGTVTVAGCPWPTGGLYLVATPRSGSTWVQYLLNGGLHLPCDLPGSQLLDYPGMAEHLAIMPETAFWTLRPQASKIHAHWIGEKITARLPIESWVIRLTRLDRRAQALSLIRCNRTGRYQAASPEARAEIQALWEGMEITEREITDQMRAIAVWETKADLWTAGCRVLHLHYEALLEDPERELSRIAKAVDLRDWRMPEEVPIVRLRGGEREL